MTRRRLPKTSKGTRAIILVRVSVDKGEGHTSPTTQRNEATIYAESQGWEVIEVCEDIGRSAYQNKARRPGLERAMSLIESGAADRLVVWKLDRLMRNAREFMRIWDRLDAAGAEVASKCEPWFDTSTAVGRMLIMLMSCLAEMESDARSDRALPWHAHRKAKGMVPNGPEPYGYIKAPNALTINQAEAAVIHEAAAAVLAGQSLRSIALHLDASGIPSPSGGEWRGRTISRILMSPTTAGLRELDGEYVQGIWEPVLERATWELLRTVLGDPQRSAGHTSSDRKWMLSGLLTCGACGGTMTSKSHAQGKRYACTTCLKSIHGENVDQAVTAYVHDLLTPEVWEQMRSQGRKADNGAVNRLKAQLKTLRSMWLDGTMDDAEWAEAQEDVRERISDIEDAELLILPPVEDVRKQWDQCDVEAKRLIITACIKRIEVAPFGPGAKGLERIKISGAL